MELLAVRCSDAVYAPSELLSRVLRENENIEADVLRPPFFIETNNLDESIYKKHLMEKKYLVFFGSIGLLKGGEALARSLPELLATYPKMFFVFAGKVFGGPENQSMLDYIKDKAGR